MNRLIVLFFLSMSLYAFTQEQTLGLFINDVQSYNGYTLVAPTSTKIAFLIDNCGEVVHEWESEYKSGLMTYLSEDGYLLRAGNISSDIFETGGAGGIIEKLAWDSEVIWSYEWATDTGYQHHDIEELPNGNILILAWELYTAEEAISRGRAPQNTGNYVWATHIIEIEPTLPSGGNIVWEWKLWDHLVQNTDINLPEYGQINDFPRKVNINYEANGGTSINAQDWIHANSIDYNESLDQIIISSRTFNEFWIIDHSHSTELTKTSPGDLMYRWGNPEAYDRGGVSDKKLFKQHDCQWIGNGLSGEGDILLFNNGNNRPEGNYSSVEQITPISMADGTYPISNNEPFGPTSSTWTYPEVFYESFYSQNVSGAQRLPNGNTLICEGASGDIFEINDEEEIIWKYVNPLSKFGPLEQGTNPILTAVFRSIRYPSNYPALINMELNPYGTMELNPLPSNCEFYNNTECYGDFNSDELITISDILILFTEYSCLNNCTTDLDFDGSSGVSDLLIILTIYGSTCY